MNRKWVVVAKKVWWGSKMRDGGRKCVAIGQSRWWWAKNVWWEPKTCGDGSKTGGGVQKCVVDGGRWW